MAKFRNRMVLLLVAYFGGFATAIYVLAPVPGGPQPEQIQETAVFSSLDNVDFASSFNAELHRYSRLAKRAAHHTAGFIGRRLREGRPAAETEVAIPNDTAGR